MTAITCLTSEELSALGVNNDNDESDDDNEDDWVAPSEERSAFSVLDDMEWNLNIVSILFFERFVLGCKESTN